MNIFSGSRRIATVAAALWVTGWFIAAALHETKVYARYDYISGSKYANFVGFDEHSCPKNTNRRNLNLKTESDHSININLCILGSGSDIPEGFFKEPFDPDVYLGNKKSEDVPMSKYQLSIDNIFSIYDDSINKAFTINPTGQDWFNKKWRESWRSAYGQGLTITIGGLAILWIFSMAMGWIVRGFLGIPRGMDSKP